MEKNIAVLGVGAVGSSVGADLTRAGHNVLLIDQWPAHVEAMKDHGLRITMPGEEFQIPVQAIHLCELRTLRYQFDIVLLTAKSYDSCWMAQLIKPYLKPEGVIVSVQNSLNDEWVAPIIGYERDIACAFEISAEVFVPGIAKRNSDRTHTKFILGELHGRITPRLQEIAQILSVVGKTEVSTNIWGAKWTKLVANTMIMPTDTAAGIQIYELAENPRYLGICAKLGRESVQVGTALGYAPEPIFGMTAEDLAGLKDELLKKLLVTVITDVGREARSTMQQDIIKGRLTEIDYLNGLVVKKGREANVPTPANEAATALIKQVELGKLKPALSTLEVLESSI